jgi:hypothetical protein
VLSLLVRRQSSTELQLREEELPLKYRSFIAEQVSPGMHMCASMQAAETMSRFARIVPFSNLLAYVGIDVSQSPGYNCGEERGDVDAGCLPPGTSSVDCTPMVTRKAMIGRWGGTADSR